MNFKHFNKKKSELKFKGIFTSTYQRKFPKGTFEYVVLPDSVRILAITKNKKVILIKEKSFSHNDPFYALPGGAIDENEKPLNAAKRELEEETGYSSNDIELWFNNNYSQTIISKKYFFIAKDCFKKGKASLEETEDIKLEIIHFENFLKKATADNFRHMELQNRFFKMRLDEDYKKDFMKRCFL